MNTLLRERREGRKEKAIGRLLQSNQANLIKCDNERERLVCFILVACGSVAGSFFKSDPMLDDVCLCIQ